MIDQPLASRLRTLALCESDEPAAAVAALIGAAGSILLARFTPAQVSALIANGMAASMAIAERPADTPAH